MLIIQEILCVYVHGDVEETKVTDDPTEDMLLVAYGIPGMSEGEIKEGVIVASNYIKKVRRW